jgi:hypothetical protein
MQENELLSEIRRVRDELAEECHYDPKELFRQLREETKRSEAEGWKVVSHEPRRIKRADEANAA